MAAQEGEGAAADGVGSEREFRAALVARLVAAAESGALSGRLVREAAVAAGVSERTVWRWVRAGGYAPPCRAGWRLSEHALELYYQWRGNVAAVHRQLVAEGEPVPSLRTIARAFERELTGAERAHAARGAEGVRERTVYVRHEARHRAECYEADHKLLPIEVFAPRARRPRRPWVTIFLDQYSRLIVGWAISLRPTQAEVLAALRMAVMVDPERGPFGGIPTMLRFDNGLEFAATAIQEAALGLGCLARPTAPYSPWQKGKIERLNRTIEQQLLQGLPGFTGGPRTAAGKLIGPPPLTLARLVALFAEWVGEYNGRREHGTLGMTPLVRWRSDPTPVGSVSAERARWLLKSRAERRVGKDGVHHGGLTYFAPELNGLVGERVEVAFMPHDPREVELYRDGRWLATAKPQDELTAADRERALDRRRDDAAELARRARRARRRARVRLAPITAPDSIEETTLPARERPPGQDRRRAALRLLSLEQRVNQPRDDRADIREHEGAGERPGTSPGARGRPRDRDRGAAADRARRRRSRRREGDGCAPRPGRVGQDLRCRERRRATRRRVLLGAVSLATDDAARREAAAEGADRRRAAARQPLRALRRADRSAIRSRLADRGR